MQAVIFCGIQGAGKSTFYKERFFDTHVRINGDMLKTHRREELLLRACIEGRQPLVIDKTNATAAHRAPYIAAARAAGFRVIGYYFAVKPAEALQRNARREGKAQIPPAAIHGCYARLQIPKREEGFDELYYVKVEEGRFMVEDWKDEV